MIGNFSISGTKIAILLAILSGVVFAFLTPLSAVFLEDVGPVFTVAALNLGAGIGMAIFLLAGRKTKLAATSERPKRKDAPILVCIVIGDLLGALFSMLSLTFVSADSVALILNFEIVSTALIACGFFREKVSKRLGIAIVLITFGCITITAGDLERFIASPGILLALLSCVCWGITHNLYRKISHRNPHGILTIRGLGIGAIALVLSLIIGEGIPAVSVILTMMLIGFATYGLGNVFFILAQRRLGAALVSAISGFSPFLAAFISLLIFQDQPTISFLIALLFLVPGVYIAVTEGVIKERAAVPGYEEPARPTDIRNILSAIGYYVIAASLSYTAFTLMDIPIVQNATVMKGPVLLCCAAFLMVIGVILIILRKRDFNGITFIATAASLALFATIIGYPAVHLALGIFMAIMGATFLLASERKKYIMAGLLFIQGLGNILAAFLNASVQGVGILIAIAAVFFFIGLISSGQMPRHRLTKILTEDESTSFTKNGAMIGYIFFGFSMVPWILLYMNGVPVIPETVLSNITLICLAVLALSGILMIFVGKSWFNGAIFLGVAFTMVLSLTGDGSAFLIMGIMMMMFGLLSMLRRPAFLLSGLMYVIYGISSFSSQSTSGIIQIQFVQLLLNAIPCLIAIYLAAAVFSQKRKLPLF